MDEIEESKESKNIPYEMLGTPVYIWFRKLLDDYYNKNCENEDINKSNNEEE